MHVSIHLSYLFIHSFNYLFIFFSFTSIRDSKYLFIYFKWFIRSLISFFDGAYIFPFLQVADIAPPPVRDRHLILIITAENFHAVSVVTK